MLTGIGVVIALYVITRLTFGYAAGKLRQRIYAVLAALTVVVSVLVLVDLIARAVADRSIVAALFKQSPSPESRSASTQTGGPELNRLRVSKTDAGGFEAQFQYVGRRKLAESSLRR
jgi:hypothetical protein